jgi:hypothetical protein
MSSSGAGGRARDERSSLCQYFFAGGRVYAIRARTDYLPQTNGVALVGLDAPEAVGNQPSGQNGQF